MTVKETLIKCLLTYPSIYPNKWAVYHHLFLVNGNGYKWKKGELVDAYKSPEMPETTRVGLEERMNNFTAREKVYPICEYAKIVTIPDNVTDDWLEAAKAMEVWLRHNYQKLSMKDNNWVAKITDRIDKLDIKRKKKDMVFKSNTPMKKFKTETVFRLDYGEVQDLIRTELNIKNYDFCADIEGRNDNVYEFNIEKDSDLVEGEYELEEALAWKDTQHTGVLLTHLCNLEVIPEGCYIIEICY